MTDLKVIRDKIKTVLSECVPDPDLDPVVDHLADQWYDDARVAYEEGLTQGFSVGFNL